MSQWLFSVNWLQHLHEVNMDSHVHLVTAILKINSIQALEENQLIVIELHVIELRDIVLTLTLLLFPERFLFAPAH